MTQLTYSTTEEFDRDLKRLLKKFHSLIEDIDTAKVFAIELFHIQKINKQAVFPMPQFCTDEVLVCKLKKFACKALKGRGIKSGIRIIYAYHKTLEKIEFLEIYFKGEKENEDKDRIKKYLAKM